MKPLNSFFDLTFGTARCLAFFLLVLAWSCTKEEQHDHDHALIPKPHQTKKSAPSAAEVEAWWTQAGQAVESKDWATADRLYNQLDNQLLAPTRRENLLYQWSLVLIELGRHEQAFTRLRALREMNPKHPGSALLDDEEGHEH